jgi:hypothetical protein
MTADSSPPQGRPWFSRWFQRGVPLVDPDAIAETLETLKGHLEPYQIIYLQARWLHMLLWWTQRANDNRWKYYTSRCIVGLGGALIPALVSLNVNDAAAQYVKWTAAGIGLLIAVSAGLEEIFHFGEIWREKRGAAELLKVEGWRYFELSGPYRDKSYQAAYPDFVGSVEALIEREIKDYLVAVRPVQKGSDKDDRGKA